MGTNFIGDDFNCLCPCCGCTLGEDPIKTVHKIIVNNGYDGVDHEIYECHCGCQFVVRVTKKVKEVLRLSTDPKDNTYFTNENRGVGWRDVAKGGYDDYGGKP